MDQNEIDRLTMSGVQTALGQEENKQAQSKPSEKGHMLEQIDKVTEVTERETNRVLEKLEMILKALNSQHEALSQIKERVGASADPEIVSRLDQAMELEQASQNYVFEAMDLLQFQDITRQKLEKIANKLQDLMDFIDVTMGRDSSIKRKRACSETIDQVGMIPDARKDAVDAILAEYLPTKK